MARKLEEILEELAQVRARNNQRIEAAGLGRASQPFVDTITPEGSREPINVTYSPDFTEYSVSKPTLYNLAMNPSNPFASSKQSLPNSFYASRFSSTEPTNRLSLNMTDEDREREEWLQRNQLDKNVLQVQDELTRNSMTNSEWNQYADLYNNQGKEAAEQYYTQIKPYIIERNDDRKNRISEKQANRARLDSVTKDILAKNYDTTENAQADVERQEWLQNNQLDMNMEQAADLAYQSRMTDEEREAYSRLLRTQGYEAAQEYYRDLLNDLKYRESEARSQAQQKFGYEHPELAIGVNAGRMFLTPLNLLHQLGSAVSGNLNEDDLLSNQITNAMDSSFQGGSQKYGERFGPVGQFAYGLANSAAQFLVPQGVFNKLFGGAINAAKISSDARYLSEMASLGVMGTNAASQTTLEAKREGASDAEAVALGLIAGGAEIVTEKVSIENWLNPEKSLKLGDKFKYTLKNALAEGSEEVGSNIINAIAELMIRGDRAKMFSEYNQLRSEGMSEADAFRTILVENAKEWGLDWLAGAIMGGALGAVGSINNSINSKEFANETDLNTEEGMTGLIESGLESNPESESYELAKRLQEKRENGEKISNEELVGLMQANEEALEAEGEALKDDVVNYINESGLSLKKAAQTVMSEMYDGDIPVGEYVTAMTEYYLAGAENEDINSIDTQTELSPYQMEAAYRAGQEEYANEGVSLRKGIQRNDGQDTGRTVSAVEEGTRSLSEGTGEAADREIAQIKAGERVTENKVDGDGRDYTLEYTPVTGGETTLMAEGRANIEELGAKIVFTKGNIIHTIKRGDEIIKTDARGFFDPVNKVIYIQADHPLFTANQLSIHEGTHLKIAEGKVSLKDVENRIAGRDLDELARDYKALYYGTTLSDDQIIEEIICDSMAEMNNFSGISTIQTEKYQPYFETIKAKTEESTNQANAPPSEYLKQKEEIQGIKEANKKSEPKEAASRETRAYKLSAESVKESVRAEQELGKSASMLNNTWRFSNETYRQGGRNALEEYLTKYSGLSKEDQKDIITTLDWGYNLAEKMAKNKEYESFGKWSQTGLLTAPDGVPLLQVEGANGAPIRSVVVPNDEYPLNIDFTTVCKKRMALDAVLNKLVSDPKINLAMLSEEDIDGINKLIKAHQFEIACGLCYVDAKRYKVSASADTFVNGKVDKNGNKTSLGWNDLVNSMLKKGVNASYFELATNHVTPLGALLSDLDDKDVNFKTIDKILKPHLDKNGKLKGSTTEDVKRAYLLKSDPSQRHLLDINDLISTAGWDTLKRTNPELWRLANAHGGQSSPKTSTGFTAYGNEIIKFTKGKFNFNKNSAYSVGGVRVQSFSDYVANMFFDYMQMFADMSARELPSHAYTKEPNYVKLFGMTGQRINMSLIFKGANLTAEQSKRLSKMKKSEIQSDPEFKKLAEHAGLDENGNYIYEDESFPPEMAFALRKDPRYKNCGTIAVGLSDAHIRKLLADSQIDEVIPYHASGVSSIIKDARNLKLYTDYTDQQNTRDSKGDKLGKGKEYDWYKYLKSANNENGLEAKEAADAYLKWCDDNGYTPKFPQFRYLEDGKTPNENYYKLIVDFRSYDNNGNFMPQDKVSMTFPKDFSNIVAESLKEHQQSYYGRLDTELSDEQGSLYSEVKKMLSEKGVVTEAKFSAEPTMDTQGNKLTKEQSEFFKDSKVKDANGNLLVMYHGTENEFTVFKPSPFVNEQNGPTKIVGYFSEDKSYSEIYGNVKPYYLNITNPLVMDGEAKTLKGWTKFFKDNGITNVVYDSDVTGKNGPKDPIKGGTFSDGTYYTYFEILDANSYWTGDGNVTERIAAAGYDGIQTNDETEKAWMPFSANQVKSVDNKTPTENDDIRFSQEPTSYQDIAKENRQLKKDLAKAYKDIEKWKNELKISSPLQVRDQDIGKISRDLKKKFNATVPVAKLNEMFRDYGDYILNASRDTTITPEEYAVNVKAKAIDIAAELVNTSEEMVINYPEYKEVQRFLMQGVTISDQDKADIPDFEDFRKRNFRNVKIVKNGLDVDSAYEELSQKFPHLFPASITAPSDQLMQMAEVAEEIRPTKANPFEQYGLDLSEIVEQTANEIINDTMYGQLRATKQTFADKQAAKISKLQAENKKAKEMMQELKDKRRSDIASGKNRYAEKNRIARNKRQARALREKIIRHANALSTKLLKPTDARHITETERVLEKDRQYESLRSVTAKVLSAINLESNFTVAEPGSLKRAKDGKGFPTKRTQAFRELKEKYEALKEDGDFIVNESLKGDDGLLADIIKFEDTPIQNLGVEDLTKIYNVLKSLEKTLDNANKLLTMDRDVSDFSIKMIKDNASKDARGDYAWRLGNNLAVGMLTPEAYFHRLGPQGDQVFKMLRKAQDQNILNIDMVRNWFQKNISMDINLAEKEMHTVRLGGQDVEISAAGLMELYALSRRQQALDHIMTGGVLIEQKKAKRGQYKINTNVDPIFGITMDELVKAFDHLTVEQRQTAEKMQEFVSTTLADLGNQASLDVYGYEKFKEENYWPIDVNKDQIQGSSGTTDQMSSTVANKGHTKSVKPNPKTSVNVHSIFDTFLNHSVAQAEYAAYLSTMTDVNRIRNFAYWDENNQLSSMKQTLKRVHGSQGAAYWHKLMADLANGIKADDRYTGGLMGKFKAAAVGANLRVILQQPTAILRAMSMVDPKYYAMASKNIKAGMEKAVKYAPIAKWKSWGYFDINTGRSLRDLIMGSETKVQKLNEIMMSGAGFADDVAWGYLWNAVEAEIKDTTNLKPGSEEFYQAVAEKFSDVVDKTQVVDGMLQRSDILRNSNGLVKMATSFMGEPIKQYNQFMTALYDMRKNPSKANTQMFAKTIMAMVSAGMLNAVAKSIVDMIRHKKRDKDYWQQFWEEMTGLSGDEKNVGEAIKNFANGNIGDFFNFPGYIPIIKDAESVIFGFDVNRTDMSVLKDVVDAATKLYKAMIEGTKESVLTAGINFATQSGKLLGIPASNLWRDLKAAIPDQLLGQNKNPVIAYNYEKLWSNMDKDKGKFIDFLYEAYKEGDQEAFKYIYKDLLENGITDENMQSNFDNHLKKEQYGKTEGVSANDLKNRYIFKTGLVQDGKNVEKIEGFGSYIDYQLNKKAEDEAKKAESKEKALEKAEQMNAVYDNPTYKAVESSSLWSKASSSMQNEVASKMQKLVAGEDENLQNQIDWAKSHYGVSESDWLLYTLARQIVNEQTNNGKGYNKEDKTKAAQMVGLTYAQVNDIEHATSNMKKKK